MKFTVKNNRTGERKTVEANTYRAALGKAFEVCESQIPRVQSDRGEVVFGSLKVIIGERPVSYTVTKSSV